MELVIIPFLQSLVAGGTFNLFVCILRNKIKVVFKYQSTNAKTDLLSVLPFHSMVPLHDMGVQRLFVLGGVVATLPVARKPTSEQM